MELMYKAFGDYRDRVLGTDISQDHLLDLSEVATQLENLVKDARNPEEPSEEGQSACFPFTVLHQYISTRRTKGYR